MVIVIHPQLAPSHAFILQAHLALESNFRFRLTPHWNHSISPGSSRVGQFSSNTNGIVICSRGKLTQDTRLPGCVRRHRTNARPYCGYWSALPECTGLLSTP